jgi:cytochrome P450
MKFLLGILPNSESTRSPYRLQTFLPAFHNAVSLTMFRVLLGRLWKIVPKTAYLRDCQMTHDLIDFYINEALDSKSTSGDSEGDKSAMTSKNSLVHSLSSQTDDRLHIRGQIIQGMLASGETISALLGNTLLLLSRHPVYWQRIRDECLAGSDTSDFDTLLNFTLVQNIFRECK